MKWYKICGSAGFWLVMIGIGGLGGAIEFGTGWEASIAFLGFGSALVGVAADEYEERGKDIMAYQIENRMAVDGEWKWNALIESDEKLNDAGYTEFGTGIFVPEEDAYRYATERVSLDEELKQEFVEWFYSGNWVKKD